MKMDGPVKTLLPAVLLIGAAITVTSAKAVDLEGYVVLKYENIRGHFDGCEYAKAVRFSSGRYVICEDYSYGGQVGLGDALILVLPLGNMLFDCKMHVDGEVFDVQCIEYMRSYLQMMHAVWSRADPKGRRHIEFFLRRLGVGDGP